MTKNPKKCEYIRQILAMIRVIVEILFPFLFSIKLIKAYIDKAVKKENNAYTLAS
jgi:hypothetical protein